MKKLGIKIDITNSCNLNCSYCYINKEDFKLIDINKINKSLETIRNLDKYFTKSCTFFGGEPSLAHNLIKEVCNNNKDFSFNIITNGYRLFHKDDFDFYKLFNNTTITLEGTEEAYNILRGEKNLKEKIKKVLQLKNNKIKVEVNMSVNGILLNNIDEFISNVHTLSENGIHVHLYSIKGDNKFNNTEEYIYFIEYLKNNAKDIYKNILMINDKEEKKVDIEFLCSFDNMITLSPNGKLVTCSMNGEELGDVSNINSFINIFEKIKNNHYKLWKGCSNCDVNIGYCNVSCPQYIKECYQNNKLEELNHVCEFEKIKEFYRRKEITNGN